MIGIKHRLVVSTFLYLCCFKLKISQETEVLDCIVSEWHVFWWNIVTAQPLHNNHPIGIFSYYLYVMPTCVKTATDWSLVVFSQNGVIYIHSTQPAQWSECSWYQ